MALFWMVIAHLYAQPAAGLYIAVQKDGFHGVVTSAGVEVVPVKFDEVNYLGTGLFRVKKDGLYGLYAGAGKEVLSPSFPLLYLDAQDLIRYKNAEGKTGIIDRAGKTVAPCEYDSISVFSDGVALVAQRSQKWYKWGYLNRNGKPIWPCEFDERDLRPFGSGLAPVRLNENWGYIDKSGRTVIPALFSDAMPFRKETAPAADKKGWGFIGKDGKFVDKNRYASIAEMGPNLYFVVSKENKTGVADLSGKTVVEPVFTHVEALNAVLFKTAAAGKYGLLSLQGTQTAACEYTKIEPFDEEGLLLLQKGPAFGIADSFGKIVVPVEYSHVEPFTPFGGYNGFLAAYKGEIFGVYHKSGKKILSCEYTLGQVVGPFVQMFKGNLQGFLDANGRWAIPCEYDQIRLDWESEYLDRKPGRFVTVVRLKKHGVVNSRGMLAVPCVYDSIVSPRPFRGFFYAIRENRWGVVDTAGKTLIPLDFDEILDYWAGVAIVKRSGYLGLADAKGNSLLPSNFYELRFADNRLAYESNQEALRKALATPVPRGVRRPMPPLVKPFCLVLVREKETGLWGVFDKKGKQVLDFVYPAVEGFRAGGYYGVVTAASGLMGVIDSAGKLVVPCEYTQIGNDPYSPVFSGPCAIVAKKTGYGLVDKTGKLVLPCEYQSIAKIRNVTFAATFSEGKALVEKNDKFGFVDSTGTVVAECEYEDALPFYSGFAPVKKDGLWGYLGADGKMAITPQFDEAYPFEGKFAPVRIKRDHLFIDRKGVVQPLDALLDEGVEDLWQIQREGRSMEVRIFLEGLCVFGANGRYGYKDSTGKLVIPRKFTKAYNFKDGVAVVAQGSKYGVIDKTGRAIIPLQYDEIGEEAGDKSRVVFFNKSLAPVRMEKYWGLSDRAGRLVVPCKYDKVGPFFDG
jgi:hypothetical protein